MTHYQYKGNSVIRMSSSVCHDVTNYFRYMWMPFLILFICFTIIYHTLSWCVDYALQITKPEPKMEYPIVTIKDRVEPKLEIKKEKKK
jgi:cellobiose-specific phosphotransferase system component IIC